MTPTRAIPPRLLTEDQAADYLGAIPVTEVVRQGIGRIYIGRHPRYDIRAIDAWLDGLSGLSAISPIAANTADDLDDAEAALARFKNRA